MSFLRTLLGGVVSVISLVAVSPSTARAADAVPPNLAAQHDFFRRYCVKCHGPDGQEADVRLDRISATDEELLERVGEVLVFRTMPPEEERQPQQVERENMLAWIENSLAVEGEQRVSVLQKLQQPGYGNYVDHKVLFTPVAVRKASTPARIWRLDVDSFISQARSWTLSAQLFHDPRNNAKPVSFPYQGPDHSFLDFAGIHAFDKSTTEMLLLESELVVDAFMERQWDRLAKASRGDSDQLLKTIFTNITGRQPQNEELLGLKSLWKRGEREFGAEDSNRLVVQAVMLRPEVLFRFELGAGEPDEFGRRYLATLEMATALGYAVDVAGPDAKLIAAVKECNPHDREQLRSILREYMHRDAMRDRLLRFAREYFEYPRAAEVFKDADRNDYHPQRVVEDADAFVLRILDEDRDVLRGWLTSRRYYVRGMFNYRGTKIAHIRWKNGYKDYHRNYNLSEDEVGKDPVWIDFPASERAGILTHPAWLLAFSDNEKNQAIQRGRWVTTKLLGGIVPDAPVEVDARLPEDDMLTLREKMRVTQARQCIHCHKRMDPTGLPFEQYDLFGQFRTEEKGKPVVTTGEFWGQEVTSPISYVEALAESPQVTQVFLRHFFRFFLGRNETPDDAPTLIDMDATYRKSGGSLKETVLVLLTSDSFLYRTRETSAEVSP